MAIAVTGVMTIWKHAVDLDQLNDMGRDTLLELLDIRITAFGDDWLEATMPVDRRTVQPFRILHGGASVALAESLGSVASQLCIDDPVTHTAVGVEINANHLRPVPETRSVTGRVTPVRIGRRIQVWNIDIRNAEGERVCVSRLTIAIVERRRG